MTHVAIVGAYGSAGVAVARSLADRDVELTLIDDGDPGGGLCILRGCMPSKAVLSAGAHRFQTRHDDRLSGIPEVDLSAVVERKDEQVLGFAEHRREAVHDLAERENVEFVHDTARFVDSQTLAVGDREIEADYVVIATGSTVNVPDLPGMDEVDPVTSAEVLDSTEYGESGIVMGFGYIGLELVPYLSEAAGMELTVIEHDERPIDEAPPEYGDALLELYREEFGIEILTNARERSVEPTAEGGVRMEVERAGEVETIEADQLFTFTGRKPNLDGLGIENTDLSPEEGWVEATMQARDDPRTFVVGDANGREPILHVAKEQGFRAAENVVAHSEERDLEPYENVHHHVIFSGLGVYPFVRVGHTAASAREAGYDPIEVTRKAADDGVFEVKDVPEGLATLVVARDGTVIGYQALHHHADSMAKTMQIVIELGLDVRDLPDRAYHPTLPEILDGLFREASARIDE
ncbi:NAD(P)/FAD-dependent oxidoreductase [Halalkalicoccus sp. NIPERK01]|uniref:dihydrolipoyl dehydrogenase family protein n=1 Tax=Halalkalicoccus sp. NIPERK01 TaxID=3053469 RepID=UPI00256F0BD4|nr:NAD(P)/FAD-dependent oxidoreductase [Halalkalicoccus sp. NIPERK01]MDL5361985.1 NAD(P)/FAD-dependent oxidoreductase [Halalkalicoccus sp. NIPERK01]